MTLNTEAVKMIMAKKELTQVKLSELSGMNAVQLCVTLSGRKKARPSTIGKIANALDVPVESIIKEQ